MELAKKAKMCCSGYSFSYSACNIQSPKFAASDSEGFVCDFKIILAPLCCCLYAGWRNYTAEHWTRSTPSFTQWNMKHRLSIHICITFNLLRFCIYVHIIREFSKMFYHQSMTFALVSIDFWGEELILFQYLHCLNEGEAILKI